MNARSEQRWMNKRGNRILTAGVLFFAAAVTLSAQMRNRHIESWELLTPDLSGRQGEIVYAKVRVQLVPKAHLYTTLGYDNMGPSPMQITAGDSTLIHADGAVTSDIKPIRHYDENFSVDGDTVITEYWEGTVTLTIPIKITRNARKGKNTVWVNILYMTCDDKVCIPPTDERFEITLDIKKRKR